MREGTRTKAFIEKDMYSTNGVVSPTSSSYCNIKHLSVGLLADLARAVDEHSVSCLLDIELELTFVKEPG